MLTINGRFAAKQITGVQRYAREIVKALDVEIKDVVDGHFIIVLPKGVADSLSLQRIRPVRSIFKDSLIWSQIAFLFKTHGPLLSLENVGSLLISKQIVCVHDTNVLSFGSSYNGLFRLYYRMMIPLSIKRARKVTTVSNFSAQEIVMAGYCHRSKITVVSNGHEHVYGWKAYKSRFIGQPPTTRPFIFLLGSQAPHKNTAIIAEISDQLASAGFDIVVAGSKNGPFAKTTIDPSSNVFMLGYVSDDDLAALYQSAFCFVFPSLTEGFGLPALEAMALGCPVVAANAASLPEICGQAALYADPRNADSWLAQILALKHDPAVRSHHIKVGKEQAKKYSWKYSARAYLSLAADLQ